MNTENIIAAAISAVFFIGASIYFMGFKNWLVWAVSEAEKTLGSKTGKLKLRYVYDAAVSRFSIIAKLIPFGLFSLMVDSALETMRDMIETNEAIKISITNERGDE